MKRMRNLKTMGLALVAVFLLGAVAAAGASASTPEFKAEGEVAGITFTGSGGAGYLITKDGAHKVECSSNEHSGGKIKDANETEGTVVTFKGCKDAASGVSCNSAGKAAGTIVTTTVNGELVYWGPEKNKAGIWLKPASGSTFATFSCVFFGSGTEITVTGGVVGQIGTINKSVTNNTLSFQVVEPKAGEFAQEPRFYWGQANCANEVLDVLTSSGKAIGFGSGYAAIESAISGSSSIVTSKAVEVSTTKCE